MTTVLAALIPVFLVIALGAVLKRGLLPEASHWAALERLTYYVLFPALIVVNIARADLRGVAVLEVGTTLIGAVGVSALIFTLTRRQLCRMFGMLGPAYTSFFQGALRWNTYIALGGFRLARWPSRACGRGSVHRRIDPGAQHHERDRAGASCWRWRSFAAWAADAAREEPLHLVLRGWSGDQHLPPAGAGRADHLLRCIR